MAVSLVNGVVAGQVETLPRIEDCREAARLFASRYLVPNFMPYDPPGDDPAEELIVKAEEAAESGL
jgi:hypothetical protein